MRIAPLMRLAIVFAACAAAASADTVPLTEGPPFTFRSGSDLYVRFSVWNYGANNRGSSPYPTSVGLQLLGAEPSASGLLTVPGTTDTYFSGYSLQGWLENSEGTVSTPFSSLASQRLGLSPGLLLLQPGSFGSGETPMAVIEADAALTLTLSEQIFGLDVTSRGSSAVIHLRNLGKDFHIGVTGGRSLMSAISEPSILGNGPVQTSGITQGLTVTEVPEPQYFGMLLLGLLAITSYFAKRSRKAAMGRQ